MEEGGRRRRGGANAAAPPASPHALHPSLALQVCLLFLNAATLVSLPPDAAAEAALAELQASADASWDRIAAAQHAALAASLHGASA